MLLPEIILNGMNCRFKQDHSSLKSYFKIRIFMNFINEISSVQKLNRCMLFRWPVTIRVKPPSRSIFSLNTVASIAMHLVNKKNSECHFNHRKRKRRRFSQPIVRSSASTKLNDICGKKRFTSFLFHRKSTTHPPSIIPFFHSEKNYEIVS